MFNSQEKNKNKTEYVRLNKWISNAGVCSRRDADNLIQSGHITVNGEKITVLGYQVRNTDIVKFRNRILKPDKNIYILLNKPKNCITTACDPQGRKTVLDIIRDACQERLYPVGRLDRNTTGLLLLTNDGDLSQKLAHPSYQIRKIYQVELGSSIDDRDLSAIKLGVRLEDGVVDIDNIEVLDEGKTKLGIEIHSGRNRIIRRLFEHFGYQIITLDRVLYASLTKKELPRGKWRFLSNQEINYLKQSIKY